MNFVENVETLIVYVLVCLYIRKLQIRLLLNIVKLGQCDLSQLDYQKVYIVLYYVKQN